MGKVKAYIVEYSTGSYDDYRTHNDSVWMSKEAAEKRANEVNESHNPEELFIKNDSDAGYPTPRSYDAMYDELVNEIDKHPDVYYNEVEFDYSDEIKRKKWDARQDEVDKAEEELFMSIIRKNYPDWSDEQIMEARQRHEDIDSYQSWEYGDAYVSEIDLYIEE